MILYYAVGSGLGPLTRALAVARNAPRLAAAGRVLCASPFAHLLREQCPWPVDAVAPELSADRAGYQAYLRDYLFVHRVRLVVLDGFPWGPDGEWLELPPPRLLLARALRLDAYWERIGGPRGIPPRAALLLEPLPRPCDDWLAAAVGRREQLPGPLLAAAPARLASPEHEACLILHNGTADELAALRAAAQERLRQEGLAGLRTEVLTPGNDIFPADELCDRYRLVVSAAGYSNAGRAALDSAHQLVALPRRYDEQEYRLRVLQSGRWPTTRRSCAAEAGQWLEQAAASLT